MYYIYSFRSRNQSMRFFEALKKERIPSKLISTPRAVSVGCGLSVQLSPDFIDAADRVFHYTKYDTYLGLFLLENGGYVKRINR